MQDKALKFAELTKEKYDLDRRQTDLTNAINNVQRQINELTKEFQDKVGRNIPRKVWKISETTVLVVTESSVIVETYEK